MFDRMMVANAQTASAPELPRVYLNTDYTPGSGRAIAVASGGDFQAALNQAQPGDVITLQAGATFTGNFTLPDKSESGQSDQSEWIVIRSSTADANLPPAGARVTPSYSAVMPKIVSPNSDPAIRATLGAHHYRLIGLEIGVRSGVMIYDIVSLGGGQTSLSQVPHNLIIDRCYIHGNPTDNARRGVALQSASTAVIDSYISEIHEVGADSQAICGWNGPGPFKIVNNYLEGAGENVMFGGADASIQDLIPSDIEFRRNQVAKLLKWKLGHSAYAGMRWSVKNLFELKNAQRVLVDSNVFEYNWADGQAGNAIVFTPRNQSGGSPWSIVGDVTFTNNIVRHVGSAFNISGRDNEAGTSEPSRRILIRNNLMEDVDGKVWGSPTVAADGELFQIVGGAEYITIDHNTAFATGTIIMTEVNGALNTALVFTNNIVAHNAYGVIGTGTRTGADTLSRNFTSYVFRKNVIIGGQASAYPPDNFFIGSFSQVGFADMARGDYRLSSSSPYRNAGDDGKDIGCQLGTPSNPSPPPPVPAISDVSATNITASSASIVWTTNSLSDSQVEYGLSTSYGSQTDLNAALITNHVATLTGLQASAAYHYRVKSRDAAGNLAVSDNLTFRTSGGPVTGERPVTGGGDTGEAQPVVWTRLVQASASGPSLTKIAGCQGCESTAVSQQRLSGGSGYFQFTAAEANRERWVGWMRSDKTPAIKNIDFAFVLGGVGITSIRENGVYRMETTYKAGDLFRIAVENGVVKYYKNNALIYQSSVAATYPLVAAASILDMGGTVSDSLISTSSSSGSGETGEAQSVVWTRLVQASANGASLTKIAGCQGCESTAVSQQRLSGGSGYFQFTAAEANRERWVGWMRSDKTPTIKNIDFAFLLGGVGITSIRENGVYRMETTYKAGDLFRIAVENGVVKYYKNNALIYQSSVAVTYPLVAAASILDMGGTVSDALISTSSSSDSATQTLLGNPARIQLVSGRSRPKR